MQINIEYGPENFRFPDLASALETVAPNNEIAVIPFLSLSPNDQKIVAQRWGATTPPSCWLEILDAADMLETKIRVIDYFRLSHICKNGEITGVVDDAVIEELKVRCASLESGYGKLVMEKGDDAAQQLYTALYRALVSLSPIGKEFENVSSLRIPCSPWRFMGGGSDYGLHANTLGETFSNHKEFYEWCKIFTPDCFWWIPRGETTEGYSTGDYGVFCSDILSAYSSYMRGDNSTSSELSEWGIVNPFRLSGNSTLTETGERIVLNCSAFLTLQVQELAANRRAANAASVAPLTHIARLADDFAGQAPSEQMLCAARCFTIAHENAPSAPPHWPTLPAARQEFNLKVVPLGCTPEQIVAQHKTEQHGKTFSYWVIDISEVTSSLRAAGVLRDDENLSKPLQRLVEENWTSWIQNHFRKSNPGGYLALEPLDFFADRRGRYDPYDQYKLGNTHPAFEGYN